MFKIPKFSIYIVFEVAKLVEHAHMHDLNRDSAVEPNMNLPYSGTQT